jgi:hypothetical protein
MTNLLNLDTNTFEPVLSLSEPMIPKSVLSAEMVSPMLQSVFRYVKNANYEGNDLFDGLNSKVFRMSPFYKSRLCRLAVIQFFKKSSIDLRRPMMVSKGFNPKGGALFLLGMLNLFNATGQEIYSNEAYLLFQRLKHTVIPRLIGNAWGYNFDWQARAFFVPEGTPNLVTSVYVGRALLAYHQVFNDPEALELALGVSDFIQAEMVKFEDENFACFNYIPGEDAEVHNASLLGAAYLAETLAYFPEVRRRFIREKILKATRFATLDINPDGSWPYGTKPFHRWVDNFHTAFNIESLYSINEHLGTEEFSLVLQQVIHYYVAELFTAAGEPKYYNTSLYPIDVHVLAESIVLMDLLRRKKYVPQVEKRMAIEKTLHSLSRLFQDPQGFFYYQKKARGWNKIPYIRWGQAWMFYALSCCLEES